MRGLAQWLSGAAPSRARGRVTVALVSDQGMRTMNRRYRGLDRTTDVLSFSADAPQAEARVSRVEALAGEEPWLGDIAIARGVAARQARAFGHGVATEVKVLALHGLLHLLGYDHEGRRDRSVMVRAEARLLRRAGLPAGLIARAHHGLTATERRRR